METVVEPVVNIRVSDLLQNKTGVIFGVRNKRSIAWAVAQALAGAGARLALTYQGERDAETVGQLASTLPGAIVVPCDVTKDEEVDKVFKTIEEEFGGLDCLIHSIAFAKKEELDGKFSETSREGYFIAQEISAYSLVSLARRAAPLMEGRNGCIVALSYIGAWRVMPGYNVMGVAKAALESSARYLAYELGEKNIRVNCISAGPINTLAARGISGFNQILEHASAKSPLRRNIDAKEVGDTALFLCSHMARGITGEIVYVDAGYHIMGH